MSLPMSIEERKQEECIDRAGIKGVILETLHFTLFVTHIPSQSHQINSMIVIEVNHTIKKRSCGVLCQG
jgi:hypothetical protein